MYSAGVAYWAAIEVFLPVPGLAGFVLFGIAHGDRGREYCHRDHESREERHVHDVPVVSQYDREQDEDQDDLHRFRPEYSPQSLPCRLCPAPRDHERIATPRDDVDGPSQSGRERRVRTP